MPTAASHPAAPAHMCPTSPTSPWYVGHDLAGHTTCTVCGLQGAYGRRYGHDPAQRMAALLGAARRKAAAAAVRNVVAAAPPTAPTVRNRAALAAGWAAGMAASAHDRPVHDPCHCGVRCATPCPAPLHTCTTCGHAVAGTGAVLVQGLCHRCAPPLRTRPPLMWPAPLARVHARCHLAACGVAL